ncbi:MAG: hypothetical protein ABI594_08390 [Ginsengibacter sp.]
MQNQQTRRRIEITGTSLAIEESNHRQKLAIIICNMIVKKQPYNNEHGYEFSDKNRKRKIQEMRKLIHLYSLKLLSPG